MYKVARNQVTEWNFASTVNSTDPYNEVELDVIFTGPDGAEFAMPGFWRGGEKWSVRFSAREPGLYAWRTVCSDTTNSGLHAQKGEVEVLPRLGEGYFGLHGRLLVAEDKRHFEHEDGTPFFWLGDTWWMGLSARLDWPKGFKELAADRVEKGFSVVQIVGGPYPDMPPFDERNFNEAGYPFTEEFASINPDYYELADLKLAHLVSVGLMPLIVGMWGYYLPFIGVPKIKRFWRYLIARYSAYPVAWCVCGESMMPWYLVEGFPKPSEEQRDGWTEVMGYLKATDPFHNPLSIHPMGFGRHEVADDTAMDFEMLQTGHGDMDTVAPTIDMTRKAFEREPRKPVVNSEVNYEGILGRSFENIQRLDFWHTTINGAAGFTYGANGIWQLNAPGKPYGASPHGNSWGDTPWQEAAQLPGSRQVGLGAQLWRRFPFWEFERHPEWLVPDTSQAAWNASTAVGIPGRVRVVYLPFNWEPPLIAKLEPGVVYKAWYWDTRTGDVTELGEAEGDAEGNWKPPKAPCVHDWVLVLEA